MASKAIGFLNFKFGADLSGFERAMTKAQKKLKKFGKNIQKTGKSLTMGLTLPILGLAAAALKFGSDLEETNAKFLTVFSSMQKEAEETAKVFKDSFGLSELAAKEMLSGTGDLLVGIGLTESGALDLSTKINELAVDLASFTNFSGGAKGASEALTKALLGERESIKSLGISITEADLKEFAAEQGLVWKELDKGTRAMLTYELAAKQSFKAIGDFERTSGSFANQMRIVKGDLVDVAAEMGARLIPYAQAAIEKLKGLIKWFDGLSDTTKDNIVFWGLILAAVGPVLIIIGKMSIGIGALIPVIAKLGTFLLANPYILLAAAIAAVAYAIYDMTTAFNYQIDVQKELGDLNTTAQKSIAKDLINIKLLTDTIKDENTSLDDQLKALNTLKQTYPGYYDEIDETAISTDNLNASTETLTKNLMQVAKLTAYKDKLIDIQRAMLDLEKKTDLDLSVSFGFNTILTSLGPLTKALKPVSKDVDGLVHKFQEKLDTQEYEQLKILFEELSGETLLLEKEVDKTNKTFKKFEHGGGGVVTVIEDLTTTTDGLVEPLEDVTVAIEDYKMELSTAPDYDKLFPTGKINEFAGGLGILADRMAIFFGQDVEEMEAGIMSVMENIGGELSQGADSFKEYGQVVKGVIRDVIGGLISQGITAALTNAMSSIPPFPGSVFLIPALAGAAAGLARTAFNSLIPQFAEGGLVTGPTTALVGEGVGTSMANPEVIAPLDRLKSLISGGEQHITVTGKLIGNDIFLSNAITGVNRLRTT